MSSSKEIYLLRDFAADVCQSLKTGDTVMLIFSIQLCELWISTITVYTYTVCEGTVWGSGPQTDKHLPQSPFTGQLFRWMVPLDMAL